MLQGLKSAGNTLSNFKNLQQQQAKLQKMLQGIRVTGTSKNGKVTVTITGEQKIIDILISPELIVFVTENFFNNGTDPEENPNVTKGQKFLAGPIMEAVEDAISKVQSKVIEEMQKNGGMQDFMGMLQAAGQ